MTEHGTRSCYVGGCRRPECRLAESEYQRGRRRRGAKTVISAKPKKKKTLAAVPVLPVPVISTPIASAEPGRVEAGVLAEIAMLSTAHKRPGLVQGALAMARLLDSSLNVPQHAPAMARLQAVLAELRVGADARTGWLADVRKMSGTAG